MYSGDENTFAGTSVYGMEPVSDGRSSCVDAGSRISGDTSTSGTVLCGGSQSGAVAAAVEITPGAASKCPYPDALEHPAAGSGTF